MLWASLLDTEQHRAEFRQKHILAVISDLVEKRSEITYKGLGFVNKFCSC